jgi:hypothetical protein
MRLHGRPFFQQDGRMGTPQDFFDKLDTEFHLKAF